MTLFKLRGQSTKHRNTVIATKCVHSLVKIKVQANEELFHFKSHTMCIPIYKVIYWLTGVLRCHHSQTWKSPSSIAHSHYFTHNHLHSKEGKWNMQLEWAITVEKLSHFVYSTFFTSLYVGVILTKPKSIRL